TGVELGGTVAEEEVSGEGEVSALGFGLGLRVGQQHGLVGRVGDDGVPSLAVGALLIGDDLGLVAAGTGANAGGVGDDGSGTGRGGEVIGLVRDLEAVVADGGVLVDEEELEISAKALVDVEGVIGGAGGDEVVGIEATTEPLHAVVLAHVGLDVVDGGAGATSVKGDPVELVALGDG